MSKDLERPKEFELIQDPKEAIQFLVEGAKILAPSKIWASSQDDIIESHLSLLSQVDRSLYTWTPTNFDKKRFLTHVIEKDIHDFLFSVSMPSANLFFKSKFQGHSDIGLRFEIPSKIYKVQRRQNVRYQIPDGYVLRIEFQDPLFPQNILKQRVFDISAGGLAFITSLEEGAMFTPELTLNHLRFTIRNRLIHGEGEVKHVKPLVQKSTKKLTKVGIVFLNMSTSDTEWIASYVFDESRKFYARFI